MPRPALLLATVLLALGISRTGTHVHASVTVYSQAPFKGSTSTAPVTSASAVPNAYNDPNQLTAPALPSSLPATSFNLQLAANNGSVAALSIPIPGSFYGFSVEMSVSNQILGKNASLLQVPFLNLMSLLKARGGGVHIRVGGNTQETATMVASLPNGTILEKAAVNTQVTTQTPALLISPELIYMMANISALISGVKWYLGVPMNDTSNLRLEIAEYGEAILGDNLLGLQVGNEPDLYGVHQFGGRPTTYSPQDYFTEFGQEMTGINADANIPVKKNIVGPSVTGGTWTPDQVFATGYLSAYASNLGFIAVENYPDDNCQAIFGGDSAAKDPQTEFPKYLTHGAGTAIVAGFLSASAQARALGLPMLMFETNTASCGGFPGLSDSFGAALWALDYGLTMAAANFSGALLHVSGASVYYNPFTPPPTNQSSYHSWTVAPIFYSTLIVAEALGPTNTAQVVDLQANYASNYTPAYAIYENGAPARVALFNYMTDPSGANAYTASIQVSGMALSSVQVKYLASPSVAEKYNITWAGQDFGGAFESDGRLQGNLSVSTIQCTNNVCPVRVPAPGFALVFLTDASFSEVNPAESAVPTFSTTTSKAGKATLSVNPSVLATSNGHGGPGGKLKLGSTSLEKNAASGRGAGRGGVSVLVAVVAGAAVVGRRI
ncbi:glycoside hydrolase family 79 protein [Athelia psychrophila]|uniref:Glycoside hydrolase family 79 protein n=1 Tax=Athelia psychrophila TaxID=1759441 RepID=A0A166C3H9_9AGAM|nr:glycoside hydrolase family 79 protein [Fibularhizoctonia sp. CBS 109695]